MEQNFSAIKIEVGMVNTNTNTNTAATELERALTAAATAAATLQGAKHPIGMLRTMKTKVTLSDGMTLALKN
jgi:hypothetical protein